jgi:hypothetical protein
MYSDRDSLLKLAVALNISLTQLRRDECDDWMIRGRRGHIYADADGYLIVVHVGTARSWTNTKTALAFCRVTQDGDDEGCLQLHRPPGEHEAAELRHHLKLRKRREDSPEVLAALAARIPLYNAA